MNKRNLVSRTAVAVALVSLFAGVTANAAVAVSATAPKYAVEVFKGTAPGTSILSPLATVVSSVAIPVGSSVTVLLQLSNGATWDTTVAAGSAFTTTAGGTFAITYANSGGATLTASSAGVASNADVALLSITTSTTAVGIGGTIVSSLSTNKIHTAALATVGTTNVTGTTYTGALTALPATGTTPLDVASVATGLVSSIVGITLSGSATAAGTQKVDLTATPVATQFISTAGARSNVVTLGAVTATINSGSAALNAAGTAYLITGKNIAVTLTGSAGVFTAMNSTKRAWLETGACTAGAGSALPGTSTGFATAAAAAAATTLTLTGTTTPTSGSAYNVCLEVDGATAISTGTFSATATLGAAAAQDQAQALAATSLMTLAFNGSQRDVRSYIPAGTVGYTSFVRAVNTGTVTAAVTGQWLYENGTSSTPATLISSLVGGGASTLSSTQVEALLGAPTVIGSNRPRLRLTAPTNGMDVQSFFLTNANGNFSDVTGAQ